MTMFDFSGNISVDLEKIEAIELDKTIEIPIVYAIGISGNRYMVQLGRESEFFNKIALMERATERNQQLVAL